MAWSCNSRVDMIDMTVLQQMKDAGCWQISFGIETGNVDIMKTINKGITKEKIIYALSSAKKVGLCTVGYFMIGHFGETKETILDTEKFMLECGVDEIRMSFFTPMPGTSSYGIAEQYGTFENDWEKMTVFSPVFVPYGLTKEFLISEQRRIIKSFFLRPRPIWQYLKRIRNPIILLKSAAAFLRYVYS